MQTGHWPDKTIFMLEILLRNVETGAVNTKRELYYMSKGEVKHNDMLKPLDFNERAASNKLLSEHVPVIVDLHAGKAKATYWTCDFTAEYVRINASYRT